jgi:hypothetical protein
MNKPRKQLVAWINEDAKDEALKYGSPYLDKPIRKKRWEKVSDHPIDGLSVYEVPPGPNENQSG